MFKHAFVLAGRVSALLALVLIAGALPVGCSSEKPPEETEEKPAAPPPPTADQLRNELLTAFKPIQDFIVPGNSKQFVEANVQNFKQAYSKVNGQRATNTANVESAISQTKNVLEGAMREAKERERWRFIWGVAECYETLDPASAKFRREKEEAIMMMKMPRATLKGFVNPDANSTDVYAIFHVYDEEAGKGFSYNVREGEEFHDGRFVFISIDGNQMGANILYKEADKELRVSGPRDRITTKDDN